MAPNNKRARLAGRSVSSKAGEARPAPCTLAQPWALPCTRNHAPWPSACTGVGYSAAETRSTLAAGSAAFSRGFFDALGRGCGGGAAAVKVSITEAYEAALAAFEREGFIRGDPANSANSSLGHSGLRWVRQPGSVPLDAAGDAAGVAGVELLSPELAQSLAERTQKHQLTAGEAAFTAAEWTAFGVPDLRAHHYIKVQVAPPYSSSRGDARGGEQKLCVIFRPSLHGIPGMFIFRPPLERAVKLGRRWSLSEIPAHRSPAVAAAAAADSTMAREHSGATPSKAARRKSLATSLATNAVPGRLQVVPPGRARSQQ